MKRILVATFGILPVLFSLFANASDPVLELPANEAKPIRNAKLHVVILRTKVSKAQVGYKWDTEVACDLRVTPPVFDLRGMRDYYYSYGAAGQCPIVLNSVKRNLIINAAITLVRDGYMGPGSPIVDVKNFSAAVFPEGSTLPGNDLHTSAWSRDISLSQMGLRARQNIDYVCTPNGTCDPAPGEYVEAIFDFED